ncbi:glycosyltransferase, partial [Bosea sp. ASV33]|uniref:glycosyltransferase n=1 Tax=Bosea sp. ASV33 TaxID=2795106 RepID=UPI0018ECAC8E
MASKPPLRILHVAETVRGGIATYLNELHRHHAPVFGEANLAYVVPGDHRADLDAIADSNIWAYGRTGRNIRSLWNLVTSTRAAVRQLRPDVVHLHSTFAGMVLRPALKAMFPELRLVYCPHGWAFLRDASAVSHFTTRSMERLLAPLASRIICISNCEFRAAVAAGIAPRRLALVHNGIAAERPKRQVKGWHDPRLKVLFVGRLDRQKGYDLLLKAAAALEGDIHLHMIGSTVVGRDQPLELPSNVEMQGWQHHYTIEGQLDEADLVVIPSRWEGFGFVALEAMRAHKPIVAFAVGALPEIIEDGVTGLLCSPVEA